MVLRYVAEPETAGRINIDISDEHFVEAVIVEVDNDRVAAETAGRYRLVGMIGSRADPSRACYQPPTLTALPTY